MPTVYQIRLTDKLKKKYHKSITGKLGAKVLRIFMRKVIQAVAADRQALTNIATGQYDLSFWQSSKKTSDEDE